MKSLSTPLFSLGEEQQRRAPGQGELEWHEAPGGRQADWAEVLADADGPPRANRDGPPGTPGAQLSPKRELPALPEEDRQLIGSEVANR